MSPCSKMSGFVFLCHANFLLSDTIFRYVDISSAQLFTFPSYAWLPVVTLHYFLLPCLTRCNKIWQKARQVRNSGAELHILGKKKGKKKYHQFSAKSNQVANMWPASWRPIWKGTYTTSFPLYTISGWEGSVSRGRKMWTKGKKVHKSCLHGLHFVLSFGFLYFLFFLLGT